MQGGGGKEISDFKNSSKLWTKLDLVQGKRRRDEVTSLRQLQREREQKQLQAQKYPENFEPHLPVDANFSAHQWINVGFIADDPFTTQQ